MKERFSQSNVAAVQLLTDVRSDLDKRLMAWADARPIHFSAGKCIDIAIKIDESWNKKLKLYYCDRMYSVISANCHRIWILIIVYLGD